MKPTPEDISALACRIVEAETRLQNLEWEIEEIGQPAAHELKHRLESLQIEESALKRNLAEALGMDDPGETRKAKIEALLTYIEREEKAVEGEAEFLHQSPPTSAEFAAQAGSRLVELCLRALKRIVGNHHPLGMSAFVNHSHQALAERYGLVEPDSAAPGQSAGDR